MYYPKVREVFESFAPTSASPEAQLAGAYKFVDGFRRDLGLKINDKGRPVIENAQFSPHEFSIRGLAESLCGYSWVENLQKATANAYRVFEAGGDPAMTPGNIPNVSAFLGSVTGLLDAALIQGYETPGFIIDQLVDVVPSKTRQKKMIGMGRIGDKASRRNPGDPHQFAQFNERYITTPETYNDALACSVTFEAVYFDQTGEVLDQANRIGEELSLRKELDGFRVIAGVTNPYNYNGTSYNTYLTSGNWINDLTNVLVDWTDVNIANAAFSRMTDQETGNRVMVNWDTILCSPTKQLTAQYIQAATEVEANTGSDTIRSRAPRLGDKYKLLSSPYLDQVLTDTAANGGLALTQSQADDVWFSLKTGPNGAFYRLENWPFTVNRAAPNDFTMLNQKLLLAVFADQRHVFGLREPRYVIYNHQ